MSFHNKGSEFIYLKGKVSWVRYITPDPTYNKWSVTLHPDEESLSTLQKLTMDRGLKNQFKKDEDGYYMNFSRPAERRIKGRTIAMTPPKVVDKDNAPIEGVAIGNGSDGIVKLELYQHPTPSGGRAWAARFDSLKIENLIPYNLDQPEGEDQKDMAESMNKPSF